MLLICDLSKIHDILLLMEIVQRLPYWRWAEMQTPSRGSQAVRSAPSDLTKWLSGTWHSGHNAQPIGSSPQHAFPLLLPEAQLEESFLAGGLSSLLASSLYHTPFCLPTELWAPWGQEFSFSSVFWHSALHLTGWCLLNWVECGFTD